jgi:hypothetical protein
MKEYSHVIFNDALRGWDFLLGTTLVVGWGAEPTHSEYSRAMPRTPAPFPTAGV